MSAQEYAQLAQTLPPRLLRFFARYPPPSPLKKPASATVSTALNTSSSDLNATTVGMTPSVLPYQNPFAPKKHPVTGRWHDPTFSLRRQADLCKLARSYGIEDLLPATAKSSATRLQRRIEKGVRVKGTGEGQKVKGKIYERTMKQKLDKRRQAVLRMPQLVQQWRQLGHGRGWKKFPK